MGYLDYLGSILPLFLFWVIAFSPVVLAAFAWARKDRLPIELTLLTLDIVFLYSVLHGRAKLILLGPDYSSRLFTTIEINILIAVILGVYFGIRRRWISATASGMLAFVWITILSINTVV
ncbi:MAG TPA: hypothetical protein VJN69_11875 [Candidatus Acidoferrales bacterium]|nr:hypothetical protein [Candidatus Acidoferrales bacterium]